MASDDEVAGPSINEDLRMAGLRGDDESDLEADRESCLALLMLLSRLLVMLLVLVPRPMVPVIALLVPRPLVPAMVLLVLRPLVLQLLPPAARGNARRPLTPGTTSRRSTP
ncbi:unnamed protein product [Urochloa humidicola]